MRIVLADSSIPIKGKCYQQNSIQEPLGIEYIGAILRKHGHLVKILKQYAETPSEFLLKILEFKPQAVCFTPLTYNFNYTKRLAKRIKEKNKNIVIIFGNVHVSSLPESAEENEIDFVVRGEGELTTLALITAIANKKTNFNKIRGIAYFDETKGKLIITPKRPLIRNLDSLPPPIRTKEILEKSKIVTFMCPCTSEQKLAVVSYSRGCPYACPYCASKEIWGQGVRWRSAKAVVDEIEFLQKKYGINTVFFTDLTFNASHEKAVQLCDELLKRQIKINCYSLLRMTSPDGTVLVNKQLLKKMADAGWKKVSFGIETVPVKAQKSINKICGIKTIKQVLRICDEVGLITKGYFIIGFPGENKTSLNKSIESITSLPFDDIRVSFYTPFPVFRGARHQQVTGSPTRDWSRYTTDEPVLKYADLSKDELINARLKILQKFYRSKRYAKRIKDKIKQFSYLEQPYDEFKKFLSTHLQ